MAVTHCHQQWQIGIWSWLEGLRFLSVEKRVVGLRWSSLKGSCMALSLYVSKIGNFDAKGWSELLGTSDEVVGPEGFGCLPWKLETMAP